MQELQPHKKIARRQFNRAMDMLLDNNYIGATMELEITLNMLNKMRYRDPKHKLLPTFTDQHHGQDLEHAGGSEQHTTPPRKNLFPVFNGSDQNGPSSPKKPVCRQDASTSISGSFCINSSVADNFSCTCNNIVQGSERDNTSPEEHPGKSQRTGPKKTPRHSSTGHGQKPERRSWV